MNETAVPWLGRIRTDGVIEWFNPGAILDLSGLHEFEPRPGEACRPLALCAAPECGKQASDPVHYITTITFTPRLACPVHRSRACSPALNGCSILTRPEHVPPWTSGSGTATYGANVGFGVQAWGCSDPIRGESLHVSGPRSLTIDGVEITPEAARLLTGVAPQQVQARWEDYLGTCATYGTYYDRLPEYREVWNRMIPAGLDDGDLVMDVGAGSCDLDHFMRSKGWRGRYLPVDGCVGVDLEGWQPQIAADWITCLETIEHVSAATVAEWLGGFRGWARRGIVITTPNPAVVDVLDVDPTHVTPVTRQMLEQFGYMVEEVELNGRGGPDGKDTLVATWQRMPSDDPDDVVTRGDWPRYDQEAGSDDD